MSKLDKAETPRRRRIKPHPTPTIPQGWGKTSVMGEVDTTIATIRAAAGHQDFQFNSRIYPSPSPSTPAGQIASFSSKGGKLHREGGRVDREHSWDKSSKRY